MKSAPLLVLSGPSGSGKSTLIAQLLKDQWPLRLSVSVTTRAPRPKEIPGVHYHYWNRDQFIEAKQRGEFLEWAEVHGNYYGTLASEVAPHREKGQGVILDVDVQGWQQVKERCPDLVSVFIQSSSPEEYERRLRRRGTETEETIRRRLQTALRELDFAPLYDHVIVNDDQHLERAYDQLRALVQSLFH
jgi:guanylate kinase